MKNKIVNIVLTVIALYIISVFAVSIIVTPKNSIPEKVSTNDLIQYAGEFLEDPLLIKKGKNTDCSGFTSLIFSHFKIYLPRGAHSQYNAYFSDEHIPRPGNLVFFRINNSEINHVGLMLNDSIFIHSPGKNKLVRTDNIKSSYWFNCFEGSGDVINTKKK